MLCFVEHNIGLSFVHLGCGYIICGVDKFYTLCSKITKYPKSKTVEIDYSEYTQDLPKTPFYCRFLPAYADFLLKNQLRQISVLQLDLIRWLQIPFFNYLESISHEELIDNAIENTTTFLQYLSQNQGDEFINYSVEAWFSNQIPVISKDRLTPEDISKLSYVRRKLFRDFLPNYTSDFELHKSIMEELDGILTSLESTALNKLFQIHQDLYKQTQSIAQVGNWVLDVETNAVSLSEEIFKIYELEPQPISQLDLASFNHPDDRAMVNRMMDIAVIDKKPFDFYYRIIVKSGTEKFLHAKGYVRVDHQNEPTAIVGTLRDATQQKQAEAFTRQQQNFISKITNLTPAIISVYDLASGKCIFINDAVKTLLGYESKDVLDTGPAFLLNAVHPDDLSQLREAKVEKLAEANQPEHLHHQEFIAEFQFRLKHKSGQYRWFQTHGTVFSRDKSNLVQQVLLISTDITEQTQQSIDLQKNIVQLARNEERYHKMTEEVEDYAILLLDKDGIIENWNKGAEKIKGYHSDEIIGKHFSVFYTPEDQQAGLPEKLIKEAKEFGKATHEGWRARKSGETFWGYVVITALKDDNNDIFGFSKVTRDLTDKKMAEHRLRDFAETLRLKNKDLERINKELESFNFMASHDMQEPLRKIKTFSNFILSREINQLSDTAKDYFSRIVSGTDRMQRLIDALLNFSRIGLGTQRFEEIKLDSIVDEVRVELSDFIISKKAIIDCSPLPTIKGDQIQIQQLFSNLFTNSLKYSRVDVPPHIQITAELVPSVEVFDNHDKDMCHKISFSDNGIGFEQQYATRIFELFQRLHGKMEYSGTGIGLAICKKVVQNHNGMIIATGLPDQGAKFDIYLPIL